MNAQKNTEIIKTGAEQITLYVNKLKGKKVALFANPTSVIGKTHLVDSLKKIGIDVKVIFGPEHGFRGKADAGEKVGNAVDTKTGISVISLYGDHKKPTVDDLKGIDIMIFDIQDVGVRFYTYISSLAYYIEAAAENNLPLLILDRPNPNGFYVDGPILQEKFTSFIGLNPVPIVHGMTVGEYAQMVVGEKWLSKKALAQIEINTRARYATDKYFRLDIISCAGYNHNSVYKLPIAPSPNLKSMQSIYCYPSTCFFEGTPFSEGRGTDKPFQIFGHPSMPKSLIKFVPNPNEGAKKSKLYGEDCYGWEIKGTEQEILKQLDKKIQLKYIIEAYKLFPKKDSFFLANNFINKLAGNDLFQVQIKSKKTEKEIKKTWEKGIKEYKIIRKKYLLYKDFE